MGQISVNAVENTVMMSNIDNALMYWFVIDRVSRSGSRHVHCVCERRREPQRMEAKERVTDL